MHFDRQHLLYSVINHKLGAFLLQDWKLLMLVKIVSLYCISYSSSNLLHKYQLLQSADLPHVVFDARGRQHKLHAQHNHFFYGFGFKALHVASVVEGPEMLFLLLQKIREGEVSCFGRQKFIWSSWGNPVGKVYRGLPGIPEWGYP